LTKCGGERSLYQVSESNFGTMQPSCWTDWSQCDHFMPCRRYHHVFQFAEKLAHSFSVVTVLTNFDLRGIEQGEHSPDNVKFPDGSRHSAC